MIVFRRLLAQTGKHVMRASLPRRLRDKRIEFALGILALADEAQRGSMIVAKGGISRLLAHGLREVGQ